LNEPLGNSNFFLSKEGLLFLDLYEIFNERNEEEWKNYLNSSKVYIITPTNVS